MSDAHDELSLLAHHVDEVVGVQVGVMALTEHPSGAVQRSAEPVTLRRRSEVRCGVLLAHVTDPSSPRFV